MKIHFFVICILTILMAFSCKAEKKSGSENQSPIIAEVPETPGTIAINNSARDEIDASQIIYERERVIDMEILENYVGNALRNWTRASRYPFNEDSIERIVFGNGRFVANGRHNIAMAYSDDGDTWHIVRNNVFGKDLVSGMAFGNGRFVAVVRGDKIAYSDNGETWTLLEDGYLDNNYSFLYGDIAYGNDRFVAAGYNRAQENGMLACSINGERWALVEDGSLGIKYFYCITYGNGKFIAGGGNGKAAYSSDGKTWTVMPGTPFEDLDVMIITYGNGRFVAFSSSFQQYVTMTAYSDDGINWTVSDGPFTRAPIYNIVYANGFFIAVSHSAKMAYSIDGEKWYSGSDGDGFKIKALEGRGDNLHGIAYGNGRFVIGSGNGTSGTSKIAWCEMPSVYIEDDLEVSAYAEDEDEAEVDIYSNESK